MRYIFALPMALFFSASVFGATLEDDVAAHIKIFNGENSLHSKALDTLSWMGLSDPILFDIIETHLWSDYKRTIGERERPHENERIARYIRALGFSGQEKYLPTLKKFVGNDFYDRYAREALRDLPRYQNWNPIIADRSSFDPKYSDDVNRTMNMLRSEDFLLKRVAAKRIYFDLNQEEYLLDALAPQVEANYMVASTADPEVRQSIAWMVKALASSKKEKYNGLIRDIAKNATEPVIFHHARKALRRDYDE